MLFRWKGLWPAPNSAGWEGGTRVQAECYLQRRHRDRLLDEWNRTAARARTRNACRPHAVASVAAVPGVAYHRPCDGSAGSRWQRRTSNIRKLVLYEGWAVPNPEIYALPADLEERMDALLASGELDAVVETLFRELESMSEDDLSALRSAPSWPGRVAAAPTITRELRAERGARLDPEQTAKITVPVLLLTGENSSDPSKADIETMAAALPDARIAVLEGQQHVADILVPKTFSEYVMAFLRES
jgi:pimeloyl-ACP methyl ester carboxylesterase